VLVLAGASAVHFVLRKYAKQLGVNGTMPAPGPTPGGTATALGSSGAFRLCKSKTANQTQGTTSASLTECQVVPDIYKNGRDDAFIARETQRERRGTT
jgi:hypothetical protein